MSDDLYYALPFGHHLGTYEIGRLLGHGGFGLTYMAKDLRLGRQVAVKELLPRDFAVRERNSSNVIARSAAYEDNMRWARERFLEEGRALAALRHPSILPVHELLETNNTAYLVTEFIEGPDFERWLRAKPGLPSEEELTAFTKAVLEALTQVHSRSYLHRDIKPQNILMRQSNDRPVLIDFGNARISSGERTQNLTAVVSHHYAPFEQYQTQGRQGPYTDLYSLGAVLYRALTGKPPEEAPNRIEDDPLPRLARTGVNGYSREFLSQVDKALMVSRDQRWQTAADWLQNLELRRPADQSGGAARVISPPPSLSGGDYNAFASQTLPPPPPPPVESRSFAGKAIALVACLAIAGGVLWWKYPFTDDQKQRDAEKERVHQEEETRLAREAEERRVAKIADDKAAAEAAAQKRRDEAAAAAAAVQKRKDEALAAAAAAAIAEQKRKEKEESDKQEDLARRQEAARVRRLGYTKDNPYINHLGMKFVPVPNSNPPILICQWETRVMDFRKFVDATSWKPSTPKMAVFLVDEKKVDDDTAAWDNPGFSGVRQSETNPVVGITWYDAVKFCQWLTNDKENNSDGGKYRLPRTAEWTLAAAGENTAGNFFNSEWRDVLPDAPLGPEDKFRYAAPVGTQGSQSCNSLGIFDLRGNVAEMCEENFDPKFNTPEENKAVNASESKGTYKVLRGGSWVTRENEIVRRLSTHNRQNPAQAASFIGFRVVLERDSLHRVVE